jgi:hypothetical protein
MPVKQQNRWTFATITDKQTARSDVDVAFLETLKHATILPPQKENPRTPHRQTLRPVPLPLKGEG